MEKRKIYFSTDNEDSEYTATMGGLRQYIVVQSNGDYYHITAYTLKRLTFAYRKTAKENGVYDTIHSAMVLVRRASKKRILETILRLSDEFFDALRPLTQEELDNLLPISKKPFSEWVQVYPKQGA